MSSTATRTPESIASILFARQPYPPLCPKKAYDPSLTKVISSLDAPPLVHAALHLANDDIEGCHVIVQDMEGQRTANLLHATLHRREGDYWNSKYWYARTTHPTIARSEANSFVDQCEKVKDGRSKGDELEKKQWEDMKKLVEWILENEK